MQRRKFINRVVSGAGAGAATWAGPTTSRANGPHRGRTTFVFVHGAWHGG